MYLLAINIQIKAFLAQFIKNKQAISAIEYAIISAGIAATVLIIFQGRQGSIMYDMFDNVFKSLKSRLEVIGSW
jgi:pilus assembly protein Flp/PilA